MRHAILAFILLLASACSPSGELLEAQRQGPSTYMPPPKAAKAYQPGLDSSLLLEMDTGTCSGVILGRRTLLTATHCIEDGAVIGRVNGRAVKARVIANDGNDHIIVRVNIDLGGRPARVLPMPPAGTMVYVWGNPALLRNQLRIAHVAGYYDGFHTIDMNTWFGDSGAAIFDSAGNVVGLVYGAVTLRSPSGSQWRMGLAKPILFTQSQLAYQ